MNQLFIYRWLPFSFKLIQCFMRYVDNRQTNCTVTGKNIIVCLCLFETADKKALTPYWKKRKHFLVKKKFELRTVFGEMGESSRRCSWRCELPGSTLFGILIIERQDAAIIIIISHSLQIRLLSPVVWECTSNLCPQGDLPVLSVEIWHPNLTKLWKKCWYFWG